MPRKNSEMTSFVRDGANELRGVVEQALAERPMLVLGLALELGLLAGHWVRGNKISVADIARRALSASPQSFMSAIMPGGAKPQRRKARSGARKTTSRKAGARSATPRKQPRGSRMVAAAR